MNTKDLGVFLGRVGAGNVIHLVTKSERSDGLQFIYTLCGADHRTNNDTAGARVIADLGAYPITCKKCLKRRDLI